MDLRDEIYTTLFSSNIYIYMVCRQRREVFTIILSPSSFRGFYFKGKSQYYFMNKSHCSNKRRKRRGRGRGVLKLEREMKADFSPSPRFKKKKKKCIPTLWSHPGKHLRRRRALI